MKRRDLVRQLERLGATLEREGANHSVYRLNGRNLIVPRNREINEFTARGLLKDATDVAVTEDE